MNDSRRQSLPPDPRPANHPQGDGPTVPAPRGTESSGDPILVLSTVEDFLRVLEDDQNGGHLVLDATVLRAGIKALQERNRGAFDGSTERERISPSQMDRLFGDMPKVCQTFLRKLLEAPDETVPRAEMYRAINGCPGEPRSYGSLRQNVHLLRALLKTDGRCIETIHGRGYRWNRGKESAQLSKKLFEILGFSIPTVLLVAGIHWFVFRTDAPQPPAAPVRAIRPSVGWKWIGEPSSSGAYAEGHSPWKTADGSMESWFESAQPARTGDWLMLRLASPIRPGFAAEAGRRLEIRCGRPDGTGPIVPCRVEYTTGLGCGPADRWHALGAVDSATGRFSASFADLPPSPITAVRVVVGADSEAPFAVTEMSVR